MPLSKEQLKADYQKKVTNMVEWAVYQNFSKGRLEWALEDTKKVYNKWKTSLEETVVGDLDMDWVHQLTQKIADQKIKEGNEVFQETVNISEVLLNLDRKKEALKQQIRKYLEENNFTEKSEADKIVALKEVMKEFVEPFNKEENAVIERYGKDAEHYERFTSYRLARFVALETSLLRMDKGKGVSVEFRGSDAHSVIYDALKSPNPYIPRVVAPPSPPPRKVVSVQHPFEKERKALETYVAKVEGFNPENQHPTKGGFLGMQYKTTPKIDVEVIKKMQVVLENSTTDKNSLDILESRLQGEIAALKGKGHKKLEDIYKDALSVVKAHQGGKKKKRSFLPWKKE